MNMERLQYPPSFGLARRGVVQGLPESFGKKVDLNAEQTAEIIEMAHGYDVDADRISQELFNQQRLMADSLRNLGFTEAAYITEQRLGDVQAPAVDRPH